MKKVKFLIPWIALIISVSAAYYAHMGVKEARESNRIARETQESTAGLFLAEKRPYINVYIPKLKIGEYLNITPENVPEASFTLEIRNEGGMPARDIEINTYFFDEQLKQYNKVSMYFPEAQKILPSKSHFATMTMSDKNDTIMNREIKSGKLLFQVEVKYKSDASTEINYLTKKQFSITANKVILIGNLGEFQ